MKIPTKDANGNPNGYLVPIWNVNEQPLLRPDQVYLTVVAPGTCKGPHLHMKRRGLFCCISGDITITTRENGEYKTECSGEHFDYKIIEVPAGVPAYICSWRKRKALVLNMPSPAWSADDPDEWPVEDWRP